MYIYIAAKYVRDQRRADARNSSCSFAEWVQHGGGRGMLPPQPPISKLPYVHGSTAPPEKKYLFWSLCATAPPPNNLFSFFNFVLQPPLPPHCPAQKTEGTLEQFHKCTSVQLAGPVKITSCLLVGHKCVHALYLPVNVRTSLKKTYTHTIYCTYAFDQPYTLSVRRKGGNRTPGVR